MELQFRPDPARKLYIQSKSGTEDGGVCRPKHVELGFKRSINRVCCIFLVAYIVVYSVKLNRKMVWQRSEDNFKI